MAWVPRPLTLPPEGPRPGRPPVVTFEWHEGAEGYRRAIDQQAETQQPMVVYFYTDWCGYCRQLERDLLNRNEVENYLQDLIKVKINPEDGSDERQISRSFGVSGYPSFFAKGYGRGRFVRLQPSYRLGSVVHQQSPAEFLEALQAVTGAGTG